MSVTEHAPDVHQRLAALNYSRLEKALDVLGDENRRYQDRIHLPILAGCICIDAEKMRPDQDTIEHTAQLTVAGQVGLITMRLVDFRNPTNRLTRPKGILILGDLGFEDEAGDGFDGFSSGLRAVGIQTLHGINGESQVPVALPNSAAADSFAASCILSVEKRARNHAAQQAH